MRYRMAMLVVSVLAATVLPGCPLTRSWDTPVDHQTLRDEATDSKYHLYVPSDYDRSKRYPLIIDLHGTPPFDTDWFQIREWRPVAEERKLIVAVPKLKSSQGILPKITSLWIENLERDEQAILAIRREVMSRYNIDPKHVILTGFSAGGYPMYWTGLRHPDLFSCLVARACNSDERIFQRLTVTDETRRIPVVLFVGKDDAGLQTASWRALQYLRTHGWTKQNAYRHEVDGGHLRRPDTAWRYAQEILEKNPGL